jgi:ATP:ADP antiporter, AAA family
LIKPLGPHKIKLIAVVALCICAALTRLAGYIITKRGGEIEKKKDQETLSSEGGFQLLI